MNLWKVSLKSEDMTGRLDHMFGLGFAIEGPLCVCVCVGACVCQCGCVFVAPVTLISGHLTGAFTQIEVTAHTKRQHTHSSSNHGQDV